MLEKHGWKIKVETQKDIDNIIADYQNRRSKTLGDFEDG